MVTAATPEEMQPSNKTIETEVTGDLKSQHITSDENAKTDQDLMDLMITLAGKILKLYDIPIPEEFLTHKVATAGGGYKQVDRNFGSFDRSSVREALQIIKKELNTATATMASVPKPLKFLRPFLESFEDVFDAMKEDDEFRTPLADLLSLMVTVRSTKVDLFAGDKKKAGVPDKKQLPPSKGTPADAKSAQSKEKKPAESSTAEASEKKAYARSILEYRCVGSRTEGIAEWGAEYVRCVTADLVSWYRKIEAPLESTEKADEATDAMEDKPAVVTRPSLEHFVTMPLLLAIGEKCVEYLWKKGAHLEGCDLLFELNRLPDLCKYPLDHIEASRIVEYLDAIAKLVPFEEKDVIYGVMYNLAISHGDLVTALCVALEENDTEKIAQVFNITKSIKNRPPKERFTNVASSDAWTESTRVSYDVDKMDSPRLQLEKNIRKLLRSQLCYILSRHHLNFPMEEIIDSNAMEDSDASAVDIDADELANIGSVLRRDYLSSQFKYLTKELDVLQPRNPEDIFKAGWDESKKRRGGVGLDVHRSALASSYVSAFVHAGFNKDDLLTIEDSSHVSRGSQHGLTAATGAIGLIHLWDVEEGLTQIDKFQYSSDPYTRAGALLAFGVNSANTSNEADPVLTLVSDALRSNSVTERLAAYAALGYGYAGAARSDVFELLVPIVLDLEAIGGLEASAAAALTLGFCFIGTADEAIVEALMQTLLERADTPAALDSVHAFNFSIGLALLYLGRGAECDGVLAGLSAVSHPIGPFTCILVQACAYAASGDMKQIESLLQQCIARSEEAINGPPEEREGKADAAASDLITDTVGPTETPLVPPSTQEQPPTETVQPPRQDSPNDETAAPDSSSAAQPPSVTSPATQAQPSPSVSNSSAPPVSPTGPPVPDPALTINAMAKQVKEELLAALPAVAVLCIPLITLREEIGGEMILRLMNHFLQFDNLFVRRAVPIALALHAASNPKPTIVDLLSKLSHDTDADTALHAIVALGVVGAGTNNARVAQILRGLAHFYGVDANALFLVRVSQGLLYSGKGLLSLSPLHHDRHLIDRSALAGLLAFCVQALFTKDTLCSPRYHLNYFHLVLALHPRWLITLDESLQPVAVPVRVGQAVNTAGLAGQPRKITGFRTHTTPVLLAYDEKVQIGSEEWQPLSHVLEGIVIVRKLSLKEQTQAARSLE